MEEEARPPSFTGSLFLPVSALVSVCATTAALISSVCGRAPLPPDVRPWLEGIVGLFFVVALGTSALAAFSLLVSGSEEAGRLTLRGRLIPASWLGMLYGMAFLTPWLAAIAVISLLI